MDEIGADLLATKTEFDELEGFPLAVDLDTHYFLNSKAALCNSGLPRYVYELSVVFELQVLHLCYFFCVRKVLEHLERGSI